jgi:uncharacterized protein (UPF0333 family)
MSLSARKTQILLAFGLLVAAVLVACTSAPAPPKDINVSLKTMAMTLSSTVAKAGEVTFHINLWSSRLIWLATNFPWTTREVSLRPSLAK